MANNIHTENPTNPPQLSPAVSQQVMNSSKIQQSSHPRSFSAILQSDVESKSSGFIRENCCIDLSPGSSKQCGCLGNSVSPGEAAAIGLSMNGNQESVSLRSIESFVCRICHNCENPENLVSPCLCKGSLTYVHIRCLERWISTSRCTSCELCQFQYNTQQTLRYSLLESLRIWYSRSMSRRALQEDCQMFSLLTLVAFGIIGTLLVAVQYYILQGHASYIGHLWTKGWLIFFLFTTLAVYLVNVYLIAKTQLTPWHRWWQSARDIRLILENRKPFTDSHPANRHVQIQHQQSAVPMPMDQTAKSTSSRLANDPACPNVLVQSSLPQETGASSDAATLPTVVADAYNDTTNESCINNYSNKTIGSKVLVVPCDNGEGTGVDDDDGYDNVDVVVSSLPKYCNNKNASLHWTRKRGIEKEYAVADEANCKSILLLATPAATAKRKCCEAATTTTTATAIAIVLNCDVPLACGCEILEYSTAGMQG